MGEFDIYVYQPQQRDMKSLRDFVPPADARDSHLLRTAVDKLLTSFDPENPRECTVTLNILCWLIAGGLHCPLPALQSVNIFM